MKSHRLMLFVVPMFLCTVAFAQSRAQTPATQLEAQKSEVTAVPSEAQKSFDTLKSLAGSWEGRVIFDPPTAEMSTDKPVHVTMRITSRGNALVHEMQEAGTPLDATKYDHPITMLYMDGDHLTLIHYCDAGNRPRMVARTVADGGKVEFDFADLSGGNEQGHMYHSAFTIIDANHHIEDWTYMMPGDKPMHARLDLQRKN